ncbi:MAG TPA: L-seryl-tRNA(Sec) selenium transferase, partial [Acidimicrobiia bacterium]|nr:L-seryl-tRNA(Sec) selenium transferase [Acidimicrobiia bacterium]
MPAGSRRRAPSQPSSASKPTSASDRRRRIPSVDTLLRSPAGRKASGEFGRAILKRAIVEALAELRGAQGGRAAAASDPDAILALAVERAARETHGVDEAINATGILLHTGLGRAPLHPEAARAATRASTGYADLEVDRATGARGRRTRRAEAMLCALTGAQDAIAVNNNAGALLLTIASLARRKEVVVSRGELIEIGGEFRLPEIMTAAGAKLVEVGTTNRTRPTDYRRAIGSRTGLVLKVHPSNFRVVGFAQSVPASELAALASDAGVPFAFDVGSGLLDRVAGVPDDEPTVSEALRAGAGLVCFSGDKLLGGPQAGFTVGDARLVSRLRANPIARAVRMDKMNVAALEMTLRLHATGRRNELPLWALLAASPRSLRARA